MVFDYKKEYKEFYMPKNKPSIVNVPSMNYMAVRGQGDPNDTDGFYKQSIGLLYGVAFTIKMSKKGSHRIEGYFNYVVPPLEGFWWQEGANSIDYAHKDDFNWISVIRLPDFVTQTDFKWAIEEAAKKKKTDFSKVELLTYEEGLAVQCLHVGPYDEEPATILLMHEFMEKQGYTLDITDKRLHHEIYLSDARKVAPEKLKTIIRHPIRKH
ncbi:transcriptional regulator [Streptococcus chenjunshii]|uniref:Transcriptional regulator n=1 Tax=Streptococcus chenjunshii TaxID=2173853 RepID=A0A372KKS8_9STRE|nr:GyrI-like domain-containing protein [Streptococcus chenjunshii]AXQ79384.1 transcriptional regulator [Streptococcus chenjunshii]RFU50080.1 transcriptional regulator [Streptococcus chenjunshii]RFU52889.1 transcriptional regulator [Streptococcus chenjunshii]